MNFFIRASLICRSLLNSTPHRKTKFFELIKSNRSLGYRTTVTLTSNKLDKNLLAGSTLEVSPLLPPSPSTSSTVQSTLALDLINHLERTSLVEFDSAEAITRLSEAIQFADVLFEVDTTGVEPMSSVLDNSSIRLRPDVIQVTSRDDIIKNAVLTEEDFFVSPPGNIPLTQKIS